MTKVEICKTENAAAGSVAPDHKYLSATANTIVTITANDQDIVVDNNIETITCEADIKTQLSDIRYYDVIKFSADTNKLAVGRSAKVYANANMYFHYQTSGTGGLSGYTANDDYTITSENGTLSYASGSDVGSKIGISRFEPLKTTLVPSSQDGQSAKCVAATYTSGEIIGVVTYISGAYVIITIVNDLTLAK